MTEQGSSADSRHIVAGMATFGDRLEACVHTAKTLTAQVGELHIYCNDRPAADLLALLHDAGITNVVVWSGLDCAGDLGDAGKFWTLFNRHYYGHTAEIFLAVDDDLFYPPDYVQYMVDGIEFYNYKCAVGLHGKLMTPPITSYHRDRQNVQWFHNRARQERDHAVNVLGTGCLALPLGIGGIRGLNLSAFTLRNAADLNFSAFLCNHSIPMVCLAHGENILRLSPFVNHATDTIYAHTVKDPARMQAHTDYVNDRQWPVIPLL